MGIYYYHSETIRVKASNAGAFGTRLTVQKRHIGFVWLNGLEEVHVSFRKEDNRDAYKWKGPPIRYSLLHPYGEHESHIAGSITLKQRAEQLSKEYLDNAERRKQQREIINTAF